MIISYVVSGAKSTWLILKAAPVEMHKFVFVHTWYFGWHSSKYLLNLLTNWLIEHICFPDQPSFTLTLLTFYCWLPPYFALTNVTGVGGTDSTSCQKKREKENVPQRLQSTRTWQPRGLPADLWADAMRLSGSARSQRWSIGLRWRPFEYIVVFQKALWDDWSFVTRHAALQLQAAIRRRYTVVIKGWMGSGTKLRWPVVFPAVLTCYKENIPCAVRSTVLPTRTTDMRQDGSVRPRWHPIVTRPSKSHNAKSWLIRPGNIV